MARSSSSSVVVQCTDNRSSTGRFRRSTSHRDDVAAVVAALMRCSRESHREMFGWFGRRRGRDDATALDALVVDGESGLDQHRPELTGPGRDRCLDAIHSPLQSMIDGGTEAEPPRHTVLPVLESAGSLDPLEAVTRQQVGAVMIGLRRHESIDERRAGVEEAGPTRAAKVLASGGRQQVAADLLDVDPSLADRLTRIEQEWHAGFPRQRPHGGGRIDEPAVGRHMGERHQRDVVTFESIGDRCHVDLAGWIAWHTIDDHSSAFSGGEERDDVRAVLVIVHDDVLTRRHRDRPERCIPCRGGVLHPGDLHRIGADQSGDRAVHRIAAIDGRRSGLVATEHGFGLEVTDLRVEDDLRRQ